jgi:hypothetical protein
MPGDAELAIDAFDLLIDEAEQRRLFSTPNMPVGIQDHCIGLHASSLVRDGGTLQIGIGAMGDACRRIAGTPGRQRRLPAVLEALDVGPWQALIEREGGLDTFARACTAAAKCSSTACWCWPKQGCCGARRTSRACCMAAFPRPAAFYQRLRECRWSSAHSLP